ncbi:NAD(P)H-binding protein [Arthrobacter sp. ISL-48]|uniref:SDR family oxidoreductase n=1 Tax=Arthrobacter sp. ISL-48 TaxID=2819110 RepID=UPI001BE713FC|nr:NAD(P)H-binding protein [Arthrobacter sp. ISL-48]MBT2534295.1 NAD(P)H-binding protein [Arthrobacter sp. ISL-48]
MNIAVAGGTGTVGRHVVSIARERGHRVVSLSRSEGVDLVSGRGLPEALNGIDTVVDVASIPTLARKAAVDFFTAATTNLLRAGKESGVKHHVALSIVGADRAATGYYAGKLAQEELVSSGDIPWTILRATQFHEFAGQVLERSSLGPLALVPRMTTQPVAAREVAKALVDAAESGPHGRVADLGGPQVEQLVDMVRAYASTFRQKKKLVVGLTAPGPLWKAMRSGALIPEPGAGVGLQTFDEWMQAEASELPR